jgi:hypothetical protein
LTIALETVQVGLLNFARMGNDSLASSVGLFRRPPFQQGGRNLAHPGIYIEEELGRRYDGFSRQTRNRSRAQAQLIWPSAELKHHPGAEF